MSNFHIKEKLSYFEEQFKKASGTFKSYEVIYYYYNYLESEPYIKDLLKAHINYAKREYKNLKEIALDPKKEKELLEKETDILNPDSFNDFPAFEELFKKFSQGLKTKEDLNIIMSLPVFIMDIYIIKMTLDEVKKLQKEGDTKKANEIINDIKDNSLSLVPPHNIKNLPEKPITTYQFFLIGIQLINKYIFDDIDSQEFFNSDKLNSGISFDKADSVLNIRGQEIKISRRSDKSIDHYILENIFSKDDLTENAHFREITQDTIKDEYGGRWERFRHACDHLNKKISKDTNNKVIDFIKYTTGKTGYCYINKKYL